MNCKCLFITVLTTLAIFLILFIVLSFSAPTPTPELELDSLNTYSITSQTLGSNENAVFTTNRGTFGNSIFHEANSSNIIFQQAGRYYIDFNCNVVISNLPVDSIISYLAINNEIVNSTEVFASPLYLEETITVSASTIVDVNSGDVLNLVNKSTTARYITVNISIIKLS